MRVVAVLGMLWLVSVACGLEGFDWARSPEYRFDIVAQIVIYEDGRNTLRLSNPTLEDELDETGVENPVPYCMKLLVDHFHEQEVCGNPWETVEVEVGKSVTFAKVEPKDENGATIIELTCGSKMDSALFKGGYPGFLEPGEKSREGEEWTIRCNFGNHRPTGGERKDY